LLVATSAATTAPEAEFIAEFFGAFSISKRQGDDFNRVEIRGNSGTDARKNFAKQILCHRLFSAIEVSTAIQSIGGEFRSIELGRHGAIRHDRNREGN